MKNATKPTKTTQVHHALGRDGSLKLVESHLGMRKGPGKPTPTRVGPQKTMVQCWVNPKLSTVTGKNSTKRYPKSKWQSPKALKKKGDGGRNGAELLLNRVAAAYQHFTEWPETVEQFQQIQKDDFHASHLCHNCGCFNPEHIQFEPRAYNDSRRLCAMSGLPPDYLCPHDPPCLGHKVTKDKLPKDS